MSDQLSSPTPNPSGDDKSAANESDKNLKPRKRQTKKWLGLTEAKQRELWAFVVLIPWVWNDLLDSHSFTKLCLLAISLAVAQKVVFSFFKPRWMFNAIWLLSLIPVAVVIWLNSRPEPKPHLVLELNTSHSPVDFLELTNDFLFSENSEYSVFGKNNGYVVVPVSIGESNIVLNFSVFNDSTDSIDTVEVLASLPNDAVFVKDMRWEYNATPPKTDWVKGVNTPASMMSNPFQQIDFTLRETMLSDTAEPLPAIIFNTRPVNNSVWGVRIPVSVRVRAKDVQPFCIQFWLVFPTGGTNAASIRPKIISPSKVTYGTNGTATAIYP